MKKSTGKLFVGIKTLLRRSGNFLKKIPGEIYVFLFALIYRLPTLGYDFINGDAFHWKQRGYDFGNAISSLDLQATAVTYHPGATLLWSQYVANKIYSLTNKIFLHGSLLPKEEFLFNHFLQKLILVIITSLLITLVYRLLKRIIGQKSTVVVILLILFEPFYLALSRALHTDVLLSLFMFISIIYFYSGMSFLPSLEINSGKIKTFWFNNRDIIKSGVFLGFAIATKSSALFLFVFFGFITFIIFLRNKKLIYFKKYVYLVVFAFLTFGVVWPALIVSPVSTLTLYLFQGVKGVALEEGHSHIWFGVETYDPGILFYPVVLVGRYSALLVLLAIGGVFYLVKNRKILDPRIKNFLYLLAVFFVCYLLMITIVSKKLDRYSLPLVFTMTVYAGYYLDKLFRAKILYLLIGIFILFRSLLFIGIHPNYLAYYSPFIGGVEGGKDIIEPKWMVGYDKVAEYFNEMDSDSKLSKVAIADYDYLRPFANFEVLNIKNETERKQADYFVLPVYRKDRNKFYESKYKLEKLEETINIAGVPYYYIYEVKGEKDETE